MSEISVYRIYANKMVKFTAEIPGNEFVPLDWMYHCFCNRLLAAFGVVTVVIPGNGHRTVMPRTVFRTFVAARFRSRNWASTVIAMRCISSAHCVSALWC